MLNTPFYRTMPEISARSCGNMASVNYSPYQLFCITTQLEAYLTEMGRPQVLAYVSRPENSRMMLKVRTNLTGEDLEKAQKKLDEILSERPLFCLLFSVPIETSLPQPWLREVLPFVSIPDDVNGFVFSNALYVNLALSNDYTRFYDQLATSVRNQLGNWYRQGYIRSAENIAEKWKLETVDQNQRLFRPTWSDSRFAPQLTQFLLGRLHGEREISIAIEPSLPQMHNVSLELNRIGKNFHFVGNRLDLICEGTRCSRNTFVFLEVDGVDEAQQMASLIREAAYSVIGTVFTRSFASMADAQAQVEKDDLVSASIYKLDGQISPYVVSVLQAFNLPSPFSAEKN